MHELNKNEGCPENIDGLEEWDYGSDENLNVTIENRKVWIDSFLLVILGPNFLKSLEK